MEKKMTRRGFVKASLATGALVLAGDMVKGGTNLAYGAAKIQEVESATKDECVTKCKEAAQLITEKGLEAALPELNKKDGKFVWKDTYVYVLDFTGVHVTHPLRPELVGKNVLEAKDSNGKFLVKELIEVARTKGEGWIDYMYPKPEELAKPIPFKEKIPSKKLSYVYRVPGKELLVVAGVFE